MNWIKFAMFAVNMLIKYGPALWKLGKQIYDDIERKAAVDSTITPEQKAIIFNRTAERAYTGQRGKTPNRKTLNAFRENVWKAKNPGKTGKPLGDVRLNILPKGKTVNRKFNRG